MWKHRYICYSKKFSKRLEIKKWKLFDYQKEFFSCLSKNKYKQYIISSDTGTGKTITSFLPFLNYFCKGIKKNILYISPLKSINSNLKNNLKTYNDGNKIADVITVNLNISLYQKQEILEIIS